ncbi:MAG TPA: cation:proton antiporter [Anaeromyxobacteraceae bacterium]|nr:cation:proton antiporter [Anaeromyxobacteraceae bacterium]
MHGGLDVLAGLATVLGVAAVTTVLFQRLRQPVVLGYLLAGLIVGPHVPVPLVADPRVVSTLSELGVVLLMFALGLEFSLKKLAGLAPTAGATAVVETALVLWLGFTVARLLGWTPAASLFAGAVVAISSTTIVAKAFDEQGVRGPLRDRVVGILIAEDVAAVLLIAALTAVASGAGLDPGALAATVGRLAAFLVGLLAVGLLVVPRLVRAVVRLDRPETTLVAAVGLCFGVALLARAVGYSVALGAFVAGVLVAESGEQRRIGALVEPVRDVFAAIFFVSVGMQIDPAQVSAHAGTAAAFATVVVLGKVLGVSIGSFLTGSGVPVAVQSGMSLAQIGEFSFIIAGLGRALGAAGEALYPVAVAVSAATTLATPWLLRASAPVARFVDRALPQPLQTFAALYGSWLEELRSAPHRQTRGAMARRLGRALALDSAVVAGIVIGTALAMPRVVPFVERWLGLGPALARGLVLAAAATLLAPFGFGVVRVSQRLGAVLAQFALPAVRRGKADLAAAPRRALVLTLQIGVLLLVGLPILTVTQPFLKGAGGALALAALLLVLGIAFWRSAASLEGHVRAGAQVVAEALGKRARAGPAGAPPGMAEHGGEADADEHALDQVRRLLPGLGEPVVVRLDPGSGAVGRTLAQIDLRGATGATVLAIARTEAGVVAPGAGERLHPGDVLALAGSHEAVEAARSLLASGPAPRPAAGADGPGAWD